MKLSNPAKIVFTNPKTTKQDIANYYQLVADKILPYIKNRQLSLVRCPNGINGNCHYRKNPDSDTATEKITVSNTTELIHQVQMNTIEFHIYGALLPSPDKPDIMVFDLDPATGLTLSKIRQGVKDLKSILSDLGLISFLKTSGGKGYHIVVPFAKSCNWDSFSNFANQVAQLMEAKWPNRYTTNIRKDARAGKIFIDWLRNTSGATFVAPYSLRARPGATVSMPIAWDDLDRIKPDGINLNEFI